MTIFINTFCPIAPNYTGVVYTQKINIGITSTSTNYTD